MEPSTTPRRGAARLVRRALLIFAGLVIVLFLVIQLIPVARANPPVVSEPNWDSAETRVLAERACFDCHSNETRWPWYSRVAPVSWVVAHDVKEGREVLNFSDWEHVRGEGREAGEMSEVIEEGKMPPGKYLPMHPEASLTREEKQQLLAGLRSTVLASGGEAGESEDEEGEEYEEDDD